MRIFTDLGRGLLAASALAALQVACPVQAQYSPYPQTASAYPQTGQPYPQAVQAPTTPAAQPNYPQAASQAYAQQQQAYAAQPQGYVPPQQQAVAAQPQPAPGPYQQYATAQGYNPARPAAVAQNYPAQGYPQQQPAGAVPYAVPRVAMSYQNAAPAQQGAPVLPTAENSVPGVANGAQIPQPLPGDEYAPAGQAYPAQGAGCNCANGYGQPQATGYESYPTAANATAYGACNSYSTYGCEQPGTMARLLGRGGCNYWFGGVYGLLMERDNGDKIPLAFATAPMPPGSYPASSSTVLTTRNADIGFQGGIEFRLGRTFGGGYDPCGSSCNCGPQWGLETVYWTLFEDEEEATYGDNIPIRVYSMLDPRGLEYNNGAGYRPVRDYWDYAPPSEDHTAGGDIEVRTARVRSSFEVQNLELNLLRLGICGGGCAGGPAMCNVGCDSCGNDACAGGCATGGYAPAYRGSRFSCTGVCGARWMQFDEDFMYGVDFDNLGGAYPAPIDGSLNYWSTTENNLIGLQLGCNGMYRIGCKWGVHLNSSFGLYGNDIDVHQYMVSPTGLVRFVGTGESFDARASKTDVAMLGELRLGASYQATCHLRVFGGWRAMGVTGIALATDQHPSAFIDAAQMANYVNSNGSLILHGLQTGVEWNY